ncbi:unnamed protein product [Caenorhabditis auriculariae]|uniref:Uncharacterized protein n=1 Tax=Caenorhabditis auriculariae TaxID=2777116 RepID=A0A8S1HYF0_9PELO|nr:unnamed protein product [Caenorhabditis auriculariae]
MFNPLILLLATSTSAYYYPYDDLIPPVTSLESKPPFGFLNVAKNPVRSPLDNDFWRKMAVRRISGMPLRTPPRSRPVFDFSL